MFGSSPKLGAARLFLLLRLVIVLTKMLSTVKRVLSLPLNALVILLLLPLLLLEKLLSGLTVLADMIMAAGPGDVAKSLEFLSSQANNKELLRAKFPNSIAVRS